MNGNDSYVGVPATTQEVMAKEHHDHPIESSETHTLAGPEAPGTPKLSAPTLEWKSLIIPMGTLVFGAVLASGHHAFNDWENGKSTAANLPQYWVTWIGVGFSLGFKSAIGVTMAFVLLQCLWFSVIRKPLTQQIDTMYRIERQDQLYKTLPRALFFSPTIVVFSALTLLLPLSGVFAPGSLAVATKNYTQFSHCIIPTGNLSAWDSPDSASLFTVDDSALWNGITPMAKALTLRWSMGQHIPDLPQVCGPNCRYNVSVPSFVFQCTPNPSSLPLNQTGDPDVSTTLWNGTTDPNSMWGFYIAWKSSGRNGTWGTASCSSTHAQYNVEVQTKGGVQTVTTNIRKMISAIPDVTQMKFSFARSDAGVNMFWMQLAAISYATRELFLGQAVLHYPLRDRDLVIVSTGVNIIPLTDNRTASQPSFLSLPRGSGDSYQKFIWGDVLKGIEEMSYNVTAALLTLQLGTMSASCSVDHQDVVFHYNSFALWVPYGIALGIALISLIVAVMIMVTNNTGDITTSFSDTAILMRNVDEAVLAGEKLRLRAAEDGKLGYILE